MGISELPNPSAAAKSIELFRKNFKQKTCLAPPGTKCSGKIISAHTLSASSMLRPLSRNNHVYTPQYDIYGKEKPGFVLKGIKETSTFFGFCSSHDKSLFSPIEDEDLVCSNKQVFLHAFRAVAREQYIKSKQADNFPKIEDVKEAYNAKDEKWTYTDRALLFLLGSKKGAEEIGRLKKKLDLFYVNSDWKSLKTTIIPLSKQPTITCNFVYAPDFDFEGNMLQDLSDFNREIDYLIVTITPSSKGGYAILSYLEKSSTTALDLIVSLINRPNISTALLWLAVTYSENIAISPKWFDSLYQRKQDAINRLFYSTIELDKLEYNLLKECPDHFVEWCAETPYSIC